LLRDADVRVNAYGEDLLRRVKVAPAPEPVQVEVHTVGTLGFASGATLDDVTRRGVARGLGPCSLVDALLLRLVWRDRRVSPRITVASARVDPDERLPRGFYLKDDAEGCWLRGFVASDDWVASPDERVALLRT
jgi:hypothetical protein